MGLAPVAPEAGLSVGLVLLAVACVFLLALNKVYKLTLGALLSSMASMVSSLPHVSILGHKVPPWDALANGITQLDNYVLEGIGTGIMQTEKGLHALVGAMTWLLQETADQVAGLAEDTARAFDYTKRVLVPALLGAALAPIVRQLSHVGQKVTNVIVHPVHAVRTTVRVIAPGLHALEGKVAALEAKVAAIGAAAPAAVSQAAGTLPLPRPAAIPGDLTGGLTSAWKRIRSFGKTLTPTGIAALVAASVGALGLSWGRCAKANKLGKNVCGMNDDLLEGLLASTVLVASSISVVELAKACQAFTPTVEEGLRFFVRELK